MKLLTGPCLLSLLACCASIPAQTSAPRIITADVTQAQGPRDMAWQLCVGSAHAGLLVSQPNLAQLAQVHRELGFEYVRFHGIFTDDMHVYREQDGKPVYDFSRTDALYDGIRAAGMRLFVELSFTPNALASGTKTGFFWKANVTPPRDNAKWAALVKAFTEHLEQRYGKDEVRRWYFEVWNEPNYEGFWSTPTDQNQYFALYDATAKGIKEVDPALRVGGPATAGAGWVPEFLAHTAAEHVPVDFVSTHTYGVENGFLDPDGKADTVLSASPEAITGDVHKVRQQIDSSPRPKLPLEITEWSTSYSSRDPVHDSYISAAYVLEKLKQVGDAAAAMSYWTYSDLFEEAGPPPAAFHGGFGLLTRDDLKKPVYFAYRYLNELEPTALADADAHSWVTYGREGGRDTVQALIWSYEHLDQHRGNRAFYTQLQPAAPAPAAELRLTHLKPGAYLLEIHRTGYKANDAYSPYIEMGMPRDLTPAQLASLQAQTEDRPESSKRVTVGTNGTLVTTISMRQNDVVLVSLKQQP